MVVGVNIAARHMNFTVLLVLADGLGGAAHRQVAVPGVVPRMPVAALGEICFAAGGLTDGPVAA